MNLVSVPHKTACSCCEENGGPDLHFWTIHCLQKNKQHEFISHIALKKTFFFSPHNLLFTAESRFSLPVVVIALKLKRFNSFSTVEETLLFLFASVFFSCFQSLVFAP